ncbi:SAV_2336 N-terminal domain-related protein [Streptomyces sp. NBC_00878]|uniref:SAV_2336 N-terminal domain-related protein n=1 Tax=Streptomyces sp. NBC_00878 TaxID=2975854 RepID=UPI00224F85E5|nr:SAV_2336 N-terminal domain-related protein [Streptomyces sp. NBC_00878]MCX4908991.1 SAV_2336 N-terminal domain-related protein [Streptomyces sp. NBC_00878]
MRSEADAGTGSDADTGSRAGAGAGAGAARLADILTEAGGGPRPTSVELAELLWLAGHMETPETDATTTDSATRSSDSDSSGSGSSTSGTGSPSPPPPASRGAGNGATSTHSPAPNTQANPPHTGQGHPDNRVPLRLPGTPDAADGPNGRQGPEDPDTDGPYTSLLAPAPPMLPHPLTLQRALRPLKRRVPAPFGQELDEAATAHRIARFGAAPQWWLPVLRPTTERWLTLHLVYDAGPTMPVWRPLVRELHTALAQSGIFRTVELHRLETDGTVRRPGSQEAYADGRTVTLLISDCMGPQWRDGPAGSRWYATLRRWSARMPVAVVQPLPERLWRTTALPATTARIAAPGPATPNSGYDVDSYAIDMEELPREVLPVPVLEASAPWLANWSALVAGGGRLPGAVGLLGAAPPPAPVDERGRSDVERLTPEELLLRFRSLASPEAFRLAGHLAVGRPELPVMRLVHAAIERNPQPQHLAEVILSGALTAVPGTAGSYAFRPGVRELLLRTLPRSARGRTSELVARAGALIDARAGVKPGEFRVAVPGPGNVTAGGEPFAAVREESVRRLGGAPPKPALGGAPAKPAEPRLVLGRYRLVREVAAGSQVWQAEDTRLGRTVAVYQYDIDYDIGPEHHERLLETARALTQVENPHVIAVHDCGVDNGVPYLVTEFVDGVTLAELIAEGGSRLPDWMLAQLAHQVAQGLAAVHARGQAHGRLTPNNVLARPDGSFAITPFALGNMRDRTESQDLNDFGHLLIELAGEDPSPLFRTGFADSVTDLVSWDLALQQRGRDAFLSPVFKADARHAAASDRHVYRLLGPVLVAQESRAQLPLASPEEQALLCMLLLRNGRSVPYAELATGLWGQRLPERAAHLLSLYAARLRGVLGNGILASTPGGYAVYAPPRTIDVHLFEECAARARSRRDEGDPAEARRAVRQALDLWHGEPLDGVPGPAAESARARLTSLHQSLLRDLAELDLELGLEPDRAPDRELGLEIGDFERSIQPLEGRDSGGATVLLEFTPFADDPDDPGEHRLAHLVLGRALTRLLSLTDLAPDQYEVLARDNGYLVVTEPEASVLPVLGAVLRKLPGALLELEDPPRIRVTFWHTIQFVGSFLPENDLRASLEDSSADITVVLSPALHQELTAGSLPVDPARFQPLPPQRATDGPPLAWYCQLNVPERSPEHAPDPAPAPAPEQRDLVRGPFTTHDLRSIRLPEPGRTAVVVQPADDDALTLLDPERLDDTPTTGSLITYYEVDLTAHQASHELSFPSSGDGTFAASVELSWHVDDPVAFVRGETADVSERLLHHVIKETGRVTRRHPLRRAGAAQHAARGGLRGWPVPGLSVACSIGLVAEGEAQSALRAPSKPVVPPDDAATALLDAPYVLIGFDGPLVRLYTRAKEDQATRELAALLAELRHPEAALGGEPLSAQGAPTPPLEGHANPLDLLRAFAGHPLGADLRRRLNRIEERAVTTAATTPFSDSLITTLNALGRRVSVVADNAPSAVWKYLQAHGRLTGLVTGGVHGRADDLTRLMPDPDCLLRALDHLGASPSDAILVGSSVAELTAANAIGLRFLGYTRSERHRERLAHAGCELTTASWAPLLRALPNT